MSHLEFERNLEFIYNKCTTYQELREINRVPILINILKEEKDFRYLIPLFLMIDFDFNYFVSTLDHDPDLLSIIRGLYIRTRRIVLDIKRSIQSISRDASYHRCLEPKINISWFKDDSKSVRDTMVSSVYDYKMSSDFFYEMEPRFNLFGPLYVSVGDKKKSQAKTTAWTRLPIEERKLSNCNCAIEYYIYTGAFPIEGKLIKKDTKKTQMYLKPTVAKLREAIKQRDPIALGRNLSEFELLPITIKRSCKTFIEENYSEIKKNTKKQNQAYLNAWRLGTLNFTKKSQE